MILTTKLYKDSLLAIQITQLSLPILMLLKWYKVRNELLVIVLRLFLVSH